jgi:hypothetical protein
LGRDHLLSKDGATRIDEIERDDEVVRELPMSPRLDSCDAR